jgi:hypothetical protein
MAICFQRVAGYLSLLAAGVILIVACLVRHRGESQRLTRECVYLVGYTSFCIVAFLHVRQIYDATVSGVQVLFAPPFQISLGIAALLVPLQYGALALLPSVFSRMVGLGILGTGASAAVYWLAGRGIINLVWLFVFSSALLGYYLHSALYAAESEVIRYVRQLTDRAERKEALGIVREELNKLLRLGVQAYLALGASVGVSMSILFNRGADAWRDTDFQINAGRLLIAFFLVTIGFLFWVLRPYLETYTSVRSYFEEALQPERILRM